MTFPILFSMLMLSATPNISPRIPATYEINIFLDDSTHTITGSEKITFINPTDRNLDTIGFHLYPNAFRDTSTVYCREDERARREVQRGNKSEVDIKYIAVGGNAINAGEYRIDGTRLNMPLEKSLVPGARIEIDLDFEVLIPGMLGHFGYDSDGDYLVAHCLPILCGYQDDRLIDWEYHSTSEFFSNFAYYDVTIELPVDFKVVSTGIISKVSETDSTTIWRARADTVINFAFVCGDDMLDYESEFDGITLRYLLKERHEDSYPVIDSTVRRSLRFCGDYLYSYPYEVFSFADIGFGQAGLELPGMIAVNVPGSRSESRDYFLQITTAHEIAHQWFYASIATNEFEEPWLDEGLATLFGYKIAEVYGFDGFPLLFPNYTYSEINASRFFALAEEARYPINLRSWEYPDAQAYFTAVYGRAKMVWQALENMLGDSVFASSMKSLAENYRFGHPDGDDFIESISESSSRDLTRFVEMFIEGTSRVDYAVEKLRFVKREAVDNSGKTEYTVFVDVARKLGGILPQVITVGLKDGSTVEREWDGVDRVEQITFKTESVPVYASIDKKISYEIDENLNNNTIYLDGHIARLISFEWDVIFVIEFLASILL